MNSYADFPFNRLRDYLRTAHEAVILVFDLETNGLEPRDSVLSCSAEKFSFKDGTLSAIGAFNRFYFPTEEENPSAVRVNGLTRDVLVKKRKGREWPLHFRDDWDFIEFCGDVSLVVAHNLEFDLRFCPFLSKKERFCTMKSHTRGKYPKLGDLARRYEIPVNEGGLHAGEYDVHLTAEIFRQVLADIDIYAQIESGSAAPALDTAARIRRRMGYY
jgi:DNA polymerase III epsilon subunit-like protein